MIKENIVLICNAFGLFVLGYKISVAKYILEHMANSRLDRNLPLSDRKILLVDKLHSRLLGKWRNRSTEFESLLLVRG